MNSIALTTEEAARFWMRVNRNAPAPRHARKLGRCWVWEGSTNRRGYGKFAVQGQTIQSHRLVYFLKHGPFPAHLNVLHRCDNPPCVNPSHLLLGTQADNMQDMLAKGRQKKKSGISQALHLLRTERQLLRGLMLFCESVRRGKNVDAAPVASRYEKKFRGEITTIEERLQKTAKAAGRQSTKNAA